VRKALAFAGVLALAAWLGFLLSGCGSEGAVSLGPPPRETTTAGGEVPRVGTGGTGKHRRTLSLEVWFVRRGRLVERRRTHKRTPRVATAALGELFAGVSEPERQEGLTTAVPAGTKLLGISVTGGVATVDLTSAYQAGGGSRSMQLRLGQVVYTLTQFPTVRAVRFELDGTPVNVFSSEGIVLDHPVGRPDYKGLLSRSTR
jgi:spore germination protein GerM